MEQIDSNKTLIKGRLIYKKKHLTILDISSFAAILGFIGFAFSLTFLHKNRIEWIIVWAMVVLLSAGLSILKWNYTMRIKKISTNKTKKENRQLIENYIDNKGFIYRFRNDNHIQCYRRYGILWFKMDLNFIIRDKEIYLNVNYWDSKITLPSFWRINRYIRDLNELKNASAQHII